MTPKQLENRISALERDLIQLKTKLEGMSPSMPWWERIAGTFQEDAVYEKAMKLGQQYRRSLRPDEGK